MLPLVRLTSLATSMPKSGVAHGATPRRSKRLLCLVVTRSCCGCGRAAAKNETTDAESVPTQWMWLLPTAVLVVVLACMACPFALPVHVALVLAHTRGSKFCAKKQIGGAVFTECLVVQACMRRRTPQQPVVSAGMIPQISQ